VEPARRSLALPGPFRLKGGGRLPAVTLAYEAWGSPAAGSRPVLVLCTGLSPSAHAASSAADPSPGWWEPLIGTGRALDTDRFRIFCFNPLGGCFGSTGPSSIDPLTGERYGARFPEIAIEDIAAAIHRALGALGIGRVDAVVGPSMGGLVALALALHEPRAVRRLAVISAAAAAEPFAVAIRSLQREILSAHLGQEADRVRRGMRFARKLGLISYRSPVEWRTRFGRRRETDPAARTGRPAGSAPPFAVEWYLETRARDFAERFDPESYLRLSRAMDEFDAADPGGGDLERALAGAGLEAVLVAGVTTDLLYPSHQLESLARGFRGSGTPVELRIIDSPTGHDAFLADWVRFEEPLRKFLEF
jgi:homoserine O-acetyltransferase